jgi:phosphate transport system substrate-binding protein
MFLISLTSRHACLSLILMLIPGFCPAETITVGGVGSLAPLLKILGERYARKNPGVEIVFADPVPGDVMQALAEGQVDIALTGRALNPDEAGSPRPWLQTPLALVTSGGKTSGMTRAQLADIYAGRNTTWDDGKPIRLVLRAVHAAETQGLRLMSPEIDAALSLALKRADLPVANNDNDAIDMLTRTNGSLGTTTLSMAEGAGVELVPIDGIRPSIKALANDSYPWRRIYYLVSRSIPTPATAAFFGYLSSPKALALARKFEYLPL